MIQQVKSFSSEADDKIFINFLLLTFGEAKKKWGGASEKSRHFFGWSFRKRTELQGTESTNTREIRCLRLGCSMIKQNVRSFSPRYFCLFFFKKNSDVFYWKKERLRFLLSTKQFKLHLNRLSYLLATFTLPMLLWRCKGSDTPLSYFLVSCTHTAKKMRQSQVTTYTSEINLLNSLRQPAFNLLSGPE